MWRGRRAARRLLIGVGVGLLIHILLPYGVLVVNNDEKKPLASVIKSLDLIKLATSHINTSNIFAEDFIPTEYENVEIVAETVHFCLIAAKTETASELRILLKSILLHARRSNVFFHIVLYEGAENSVPDLFREMCELKNLRYEFIYVDLRKYLMDMFQNNVTNSNRHSRIYGLAKLFMFKIMGHLDKCLVMDTDIIFAADPIFLWNAMIPKLEYGFAITAAENKPKRYFNSGLMLQNFDLMRRLNFTRFYDLDMLCRKIKQNDSLALYYRCGGDQHILQGIRKRHPSLFFLFPSSWNLIRCGGFYNFTFSNHSEGNLFFGAAHLTCMPDKQYKSAFEGFITLPGIAREKYKMLIDYIIFVEELTFPNLCNRPNTIVQNKTF